MLKAAKPKMPKDTSQLTEANLKAKDLNDDMLSNTSVKTSSTSLGLLLLILTFLKFKYS